MKQRRRHGFEWLLSDTQEIRTVQWEIFTGANFHGKASRLFRRTFCGFYFRGCGMLWPHPYQLMATPHMRNGTEQQTEDASLCNNGLIFLCVEAFTIKKVSRLPPRLRNQRVGFSTADLDFDNFGMSHGFVGILYSSRLPFPYSNHLEGRQTVCREPSRSHRY